MTADFSPTMLKGFLHARCEMAGYRAVFPDPKASTRRPPRSFEAARAAEKERIRKSAGVSVEQIDLAWSGRTLGVEPREKLWRALGVDLATYGVKLVDYGKWEKVA
jgi:hypothetical protein